MFKWLTKTNKNTADVDAGLVTKWLSWSGVGRANPQWFQLGEDINGVSAMQSSTVYSCVNIISQEMARFHIGHFLQDDTGTLKYLPHSTPGQLLIKPNNYQTRSDFFMFMLMSLLLTGNFYAVAVRNNKDEIIALHPQMPNTVHPYVVPDAGDIFYQTSYDQTNPGINYDAMVPKRNMLHVRLFCLNHPLVGLSPITALSQQISKSETIVNKSKEFFDNMSKPDGLLTTPSRLSPDQLKQLAQAWNNAKQGKTAVLDNDIKYQQLSLSAQDADLMNQYKMTKRDIASVFRVPLFFLGEGDMTFANVESLSRSFIVSTLGFYIEHIEARNDYPYEVRRDP